MISLHSTLRFAATFLVVLASTFSFPQRSWAQFTTASLGGTVIDSSGAGIPDALVNVLNVGTGFTQDARTSTTGAFLFPRLPVGTYLLRIEKACRSSVSNRATSRQSTVTPAEAS
ncbi:MAG: carboxypeptidase regulatory-like domain-containing protein [Acidobacteria bacterium]|nr:MAG: carboxypeptidase regulatory-like domain-containing protein [Acidobacteriota bacterium]